MVTGEILKSTEGLKVGDVVHISTKHTSKQDGMDFWWRRFACVTKIPSRTHMRVLHLKLNPDPEKDVRVVDFFAPPDEQVLTLLTEDRWPQGVVVIRTKLLMTGQLKLEI